MATIVRLLPREGVYKSTQGGSKVSRFAGYRIRGMLLTGGTSARRSGYDRDTNLRTVTIDSFESLEAHTAAWNDLALIVPQRLPMLTPSWAISFFEHRLAPGETWRCIFAYDGDNLVGVLPIVVTPSWWLGKLHTTLRTPWTHTHRLAMCSFIRRTQSEPFCHCLKPWIVICLDISVLRYMAFGKPRLPWPSYGREYQAI